MDELPKISISLGETKEKKVDEFLKQQAELRPAAPPPGGAQPMSVPFYYNPILVYSIAGALAGFLVAHFMEPFVSESNRHANQETLVVGALAMFPCTGAVIGLFIAITDALLSRNLQRALLCGGVGLGVGFLGGALGFLAACVVYGAGQMVRQSIPGDGLSGPHFYVQMVSRAMAWTIVSAGMGLGQGFALKSKKLVLNGLIGGLMGGFFGGLFFDPVDKLVQGPNFGTGQGTAEISRLVGITAVGLGVGFFIGLVEAITKDAWLYMKAGPLAGKQFVIFKDPTVLGSSPKCEVYLFKDPAIEPKHAEITAAGPRYQIKDLGTREGVHVNGQRVTTRILQPGDTIVIGETVLQYAERERKRS